MEVQKAAGGPGATSTGLVKCGTLLFMPTEMGGTWSHRGFSQVGSEGCHRVQTGPDGREV